MESVLERISSESDLSSGDLEKVVESLVELTGYCQDGENRNKLDPTCFRHLGRILETLMKSESLRDDIFVEAFRFLRNSVVACRRNQDAVREESGLYRATQCFLQKACCCDNKFGDDDGVKKDDSSLQDMEPLEHLESKLLAVRCSLQFLANSMVDNLENTVEVCTLFLEDLSRVICTFSSDEKVVQYVAMVVHISLKGICTQVPTKLELHVIMPPTIIQCFLQNLHLEFVVYAMESLVVLENFTDIHETLEPEARIRLLNFLNARSDLIPLLNEKVITMIKSHFIERSDFILRSKLGDRDNTFCWEIAVLLEVLGSISLTEKATTIKSDQVLLTTVLCLLKQIHEAGKSSQENGADDNVFSLVDDLDKLTSKSVSKSEMDDIRAHPTFQFKAHLIRLIANLVHRSTQNQDKVRELECLPIILDNCKIDARNPFIAQWSVLAIRNLCEGNDTNQTYIRQVQKVDTEKLLPKLELVNLSD